MSTVEQAVPVIEYGVQLLIPRKLGRETYRTCGECGARTSTGRITDAVFGPFRALAQQAGTLSSEHVVLVSDGRFVKFTFVAYGDPESCERFRALFDAETLKPQPLEDGVEFDAPVEITDEWDDSPLTRAIKANLEALWEA